MNTLTKISRRAAWVVVFAATLVAAPVSAFASPSPRAALDDPKPDPPKPSTSDDPTPPKPEAIPMPQQTAEEIIREIEAKMVDAEKLLAVASSTSEGSASMQDVIKKIDELLKNAGSKQQEILDALKKLEEQAVPVPSGGGGSSQDQDQKKPQKPQKQQPDKEDKSLQKLDPGNSKDQSGKKEPERKQPTNGRSKPPDSKTDKNDLPKAFEQWGNLPSTIKEQMNQGNFEMFPPQYRALLERFFKRLADSETSTKK